MQEPNEQKEGNGQMSEPKSLRELVSITTAIRDALADGQEFIPEQLKTLGFTKDETEVMLRDKVDAIAFVLDDLDGMAAQLKARADLNASAAKRFSGAAERLKTYLKGTMEAYGLEEVSGSDERFKLCTAAMRLVITDMDALPDTHKMQVVVTEPNKDRIKKDLEDFKEVPGAKLEGGSSLRRFSVKPKGKKVKE